MVVKRRQKVRDPPRSLLGMERWLSSQHLPCNPKDLSLDLSTHVISYHVILHKRWQFQLQGGTNRQTTGVCGLPTSLNVSSRFRKRPCLRQVESNKRAPDAPPYVLSHRQNTHRHTHTLRHTDTHTQAHTHTNFFLKYFNIKWLQGIQICQCVLGFISHQQQKLRLLLQ